MTLRDEFEKEYKWCDKREQPMFLSVKYIHWLEARLEACLKGAKNTEQPLQSD